MKRAVTVFGAVVLLCAAFAMPARAQNQLLQGTEIHLRLLTGLSTAVTRAGDPFVAEVTQPVYFGSRVILPAGSLVHGTVGVVDRPRHFAIFRGQAAMSLSFRDLQVESRLFPARMTILSLQSPPVGNRAGKYRKDVKVDEGQVLEGKRDIKGDVIAGAIGTGGGTLVGAVFSHVARGFGLGLAGSAVYIMERKGKEIVLPAQTEMDVRLDNTLTLPTIRAATGDTLPESMASR